MRASPSPAARMVAASTAWASWRTLPGHSAASAARNASRDIVMRGSAWFSHAWAQKWAASSTMSERRSASDGTRSGSTCRR